MTKQSTDARLRRLLALVPWVAAHDGPTIAEVCARFGCTEEELQADLDLLFVCGVYPFSPDTLIEVDLDAGRVWIRYAYGFARPLRLTPVEALTLVTTGAGLLAVPGTDPEGPLASGLAKVAAVLGVDPDEVVEIELGEASRDVLDVVHRGADTHRSVELDYYSFGRDVWARRRIDPHRVFNHVGQWYVAAHSHEAGADRLFRVDRMRNAVLLDATFEPPAEPPPSAVYNPSPEDPVVELRLSPRARWVSEQYPLESSEEAADGTLIIRLRVSERAWLERLLLRLGPDATMLSGAEGVAAGAADRVLKRYRSGSVQAS